MKTIKCTHIDTGGHGYLSVSKKDIELVGIQKQISGYSGHSLTRLYLEEDCDASLFMDKAEEMGIKVDVSSGYNLKFNITHNYVPELFDFVPTMGLKILVNDEPMTITGTTDSRIIVETVLHKRYGVCLSNPFRFITGLQ